jgi:hypothetical protein
LVADDILSTIVEFSVAVAGFSGIVAALALSRPSQWPFVSQALFTALLFSTAISASVSLFAMVLLASPVSPATAWATASVAHGVILLGVIALRTRQGRGSGVEITSRVAVVFAVMLGIASTQSVNAFRFQLAWVCVGCLSLYAAMGFGYFLLLVTSIWGISPAAQRGDEADVE